MNVFFLSEATLHEKFGRLMQFSAILVVGLFLCIVLLYSSQPAKQAVLLDRYALEIKALEKQKHELELALTKGSGRATKASLANPSPSGAVAASLNSPSATAEGLPLASVPASSSFASSIDAYVHNLEHELVPPQAAALPAAKTLSAAGLGGAKSVSSKIHELRLVKEQLERELDSVAHGAPSTHPARSPSSEDAASAFSATTAAEAAAADAAAVRRQRRQRQRASAAELMRQKAALERRLAAYSKEKDPVVQGVLAKYRSQQAGLLARVRESVENVLGSLGAAMTPQQRERQLLLEAQAMGDVSPREAFAQRVIARGNALLRHARARPPRTLPRHDADASRLPAAGPLAADLALADSHGGGGAGPALDAAAATGGRRGGGAGGREADLVRSAEARVRALRAELKQAQQVAALEAGLEAAGRGLSRA